jgi:hypothetical protein
MNVFKEFPDFAFLTPSQIDDLKNSDHSVIQRIEDNDNDVECQMIDLIVDKLNLDRDNEYYFDITVSLNDLTFTINSIHESDYGTYNIIVNDKLDLPQLPMTLPMPHLFSMIINNNL